MAGPFTYLGYQELWYQAYRDDETGKMLAPVPDGGTYFISAIDGESPVPPPDGRWEAAPPPVVPVKPAAPAAQTAPAPAPAPEGGEE